MTLRARLLLALLAVALIPTGIFTVFTLDQLARAMGRWYRPGVDRALESSLEVTKSSLTRLESFVMQQSAERAARWPGAADGATGASVSAGLRSSGLDFLQVYRRAPAGWAMVDQFVTPELLLPREIALGPELEAALAGDHLVRSPRGALAGVTLAPGGDALVAGIVTEPDFFARVEEIALGVTHYRRLGVYVDLERRVVVFLVVGVVVLLIAGGVLLATRFAREMSRPIDELSGALARVAAGDLGARVTPRGALELRSLGTSFNVMTERLAAAREALQSAEREAAWRDVARKLAHEFKNLLTPMQLSLQLLEQQIGALEPKSREAAHRSLRATLREVGHLGRLAEQFSQYARLPEPRFETLDAVEVVRSAAALTPQSPIEVQAANGEVPVQGDRLLLSRAVHNLLLNACEASPVSARVEARVAATARDVVIEILDGGTGLPEGLEDRVFEPYVSTKRRGSGLGLSLVRDIVRQHGGVLTLENRSGGGAVARIVLPRFGPGAEKG